MPSAARLDAIRAILQRPSLPVQQAAPLQVRWAVDVFGLAAMK